MLNRFQYTDAKGKISNRVVFVEEETAESMFAQDLGELSETEVTEYLLARENALMQYAKLLYEINAAYDLKYRYRNFLKRNITNLTKD